MLYMHMIMCVYCIYIYCMYTFVCIICACIYSIHYNIYGLHVYTMEYYSILRKSKVIQIEELEDIVIEVSQKEGNS